MTADETVTLYRPVGPKGLELIERSGFSAFPPRLPEQPIFYPVLNQEYAEQMYLPAGGVDVAATTAGRGDVAVAGEAG